MEKCLTACKWCQKLLNFSKSLPYSSKNFMLELQCSWPDYWSLHIVQNPANNKEDCYCYYKKREKYCINNNNERKCNVAVIIYESDF